MTTVVIALRPIAGGWSVSLDGVSNTLAFHRGSHAEASARRLSRALIQAGVQTQIQLHLCEGEPVAQLRYAASSLQPAIAWTGKPSASRAA